MLSLGYFNLPSTVATMWVDATYYLVFGLTHNCSIHSISCFHHELCDFNVQINTYYLLTKGFMHRTRDPLIGTYASTLL